MIKKAKKSTTKTKKNEKKKAVSKTTSKSTIIKKIQSVLDKVRPSLNMDGGDVEYVNFDEKRGILNVRLMGMCSHCPMSQVTLKQGIEATLKKTIKEVKKVVSV